MKLEYKGLKWKHSLVYSECEGRSEKLIFKLFLLIHKFKLYDLNKYKQTLSK